jgi:hypothetical protein
MKTFTIHASFAARISITSTGRYIQNAKFANFPDYLYVYVCMSLRLSVIFLFIYVIIILSVFSLLLDVAPTIIE